MDPVSSGALALKSPQCALLPAGLAWRCLDPAGGPAEVHLDPPTTFQLSSTSSILLTGVTSQVQRLFRESRRKGREVRLYVSTRDGRHVECTGSGHRDGHVPSLPGSDGRSG